MLRPASPADLPSLTSLRAVEAAGRLGGFTNAARELRISPAAVAQHVKTVEQWCGHQLFERHPRGVALTSRGAAALGELTEGFAALARAAANLQSLHGPDTAVRIAALPAIAQLWLSPRLGELREALGQAAITVHAVDELPEGSQHRYEMSIFYADEADVAEADPKVVVGASDELILVAAPGTAATITTASGLASHTLLADQTWHQHWDRWRDRAGASVSPASTLNFSLFSLALDAAVRSDGFTVGPRTLIADRINAGHLVEPLAVAAPMRQAICCKIAPGPRQQLLTEWARRQLHR